MPNRVFELAVGKDAAKVGEPGFPFTLGNSSGSIISVGRTSGDGGVGSEEISTTSAAGG